jgi:hypothetical protein
MSRGNDGTVRFAFSLTWDARAYMPTNWILGIDYDPRCMISFKNVGPIGDARGCMALSNSGVISGCAPAPGNDPTITWSINALTSAGSRDILTTGCIMSAFLRNADYVEWAHQRTEIIYTEASQLNSARRLVVRDFITGAVAAGAAALLLA